jgi:hypothetical protein
VPRPSEVSPTAVGQIMLESKSYVSGGFDDEQPLEGKISCVCLNSTWESYIQTRRSSGKCSLQLWGWRGERLSETLLCSRPCLSPTNLPYKLYSILKQHPPPMKALFQSMMLEPREPISTQRALLTYQIPFRKFSMQAWSRAFNNTDPSLGGIWEALVIPDGERSTMQDRRVMVCIFHTKASYASIACSQDG